MTERVTEMQDVYDLIIATCQDDPEFHAWGASALRFLNRLERDSDGTAAAALCEDIAVPKDCQARAEGRRPETTALSQHRDPMSMTVFGRAHRWWRRFNRSPLIGDLRFIKLEHRARYRKYFESGSLGQALGALYDAYCTKRLKDQ